MGCSDCSKAQQALRDRVERLEATVASILSGNVDEPISYALTNKAVAKAREEEMAHGRSTSDIRPFGF